MSVGDTLRHIWDNVAHDGGHNNPKDVEHDLDAIVNNTSDGGALHQLQLDSERLRKDPSVIAGLQSQMGRDGYNVKIDKDGSIDFTLDKMFGNIGMEGEGEYQIHAKPGQQTDAKWVETMEPPYQ